jgi:hypothetical protein
MVTTFRIRRDAMTQDAPTTGQLFAGDLSLYTLERPWKGNARGISCIPIGVYPVIVAPSDHFGRPMPHLLDVPGRSDILIHPGNTVADIRGCILVGMSRERDVLQYSATAFGLFTEWLSGALAAGNVALEIEVVPLERPATEAA